MGDNGKLDVFECTFSHLVAYTEKRKPTCESEEDGHAGPLPKRRRESDTQSVTANGWSSRPESLGEDPFVDHRPIAFLNPDGLSWLGKRCEFCIRTAMRKAEYGT